MLLCLENNHDIFQILGRNCSRTRQHADSSKHHDPTILQRAASKLTCSSGNQVAANRAREDVAQALAKVEQAKDERRRVAVALAHVAAHARPHGRVAGAEEAVRDGEAHQQRQRARQPPHGEARDGGDGDGRGRQRVGRHLAVRQVAKRKLAADLRDAHDGEQHGAAALPEAERARVRRQVQRGEEVAEALQRVGQRVRPEETAAQEAPVGPRGRALALRDGQAALEEGDHGPREDDEGDGDGAQGRGVAVAGEQRLDDEGHHGARDARGAAQDAVGHAAACDPVLADHVQDRVVEDEEAQPVGDALGEDERLEGGGKKPATRLRIQTGPV